MTGDRPRPNRLVSVLRTCGALLFLVCGALQPAHGQMQLPGATNGIAAGTQPSIPSEAGEPRVSKPVALTPPSEDTILGHPLSLDGNKGTMTFDHVGDDLALTKLILMGDKISKPGQACSIEVSMVSPVIATTGGHPNGAFRFDVPLTACPFSIDILDGAVLASRPDPSCDFVAADCRITPGGLWGPTAADISAKQVKDLEHQRVRIETAMRTNFHALLKQAGKDRAAVKAIARDQAAFSSDREMTCRDYQQESVHGFCSTKITEARSLALLAKFGIEAPMDRHRAVHVRHPAKPVVTFSKPVELKPVDLKPEASTH